MKNIFSIIFISLVAQASFAQQGRIDRAEMKLENLAYAEAIDTYESVVKQGVDSAEVAKNLAMSYLEIRDFKNAETWYSVVVKNDPEPEDFYNYADVLKSNGKYAESSSYMQKYLDMNAGDRRAQMHVRAGEYHKKLSENPERFLLRNESVNTARADFSPSYYGNQVIFASARKESVGVKYQFSWNNEPFLDLFSADVSSDGTLSGTKSFSKVINTVYHEGPLTFSADYSKVYFTRNNYINKKKGKSEDDVIMLKIYTSEKNDIGWSVPKEFVHNNDDYSVGHPTITQDGKRMYFASDMPGGFGGVDIWYSNAEGDSWGKPENLGPDINTEGNEMFPFIHPDGTLYFSSDGLVGLGGLDVFEAAAVTYGFKEPENLGYPLNSKSDDFGFILNSEKLAGFVSSNREGGKGDDDIYSFTMKKELPLTIEGVVVNAEGMTPLPGSKITLFDADGSIVDRAMVGQDGAFSFDLDKTKCNYKILAEYEANWSEYTSFNTPCDVKAGAIDLGEIPLDRMKWSAIGTIKEKGTNKPLPGFKVTLTPKDGSAEEFKLTAADGKVQFPLEGDTDYDIRFEKEGYFAKTGSFTTMGMEPGIIEINKYIDLTFEKIVLGKEIKIENIYYDYDKSFIRPDAAIELDKIVKVLTDNPTMEIEMGSHTDARGSDAYNMKLSQRRAKSAMEYLVSQGISSSRLTWQGYGETKVINRCSNGVKCSDEEHEQNRRTVFKVTKF